MIMRWKGLIAFIVIAGIWAGLTLIFMDKWIESGLEKMGQAITGAKVEIDQLDFRLLDLSIEWQRLQITDPKHTMKNLVETGRTAFRMNLSALLRKRIVIEEMALEQVRSGTQRASDGALPKRIKKMKTKPGIFDKAKIRLQHEIENLPVMRFNPDDWKKKLNLDSLIVMGDLSLPVKVDSAITTIDSTEKRWQRFYRNFHPENDLEQIKNKFANLDPQTIRTVPELLNTLQQVQEAQKTLKSLQDTVKTRHIMINQDFQKLASYQKNAAKWARQDYQHVLEKAKLPDLNVRNIGLMLFGGSVVQRIDQVLDLVAMIRKYMPKKSNRPEKKKPTRGKGQDILFPGREVYPNFIIKKITLSGQTGPSAEESGIRLTGSATNLTNQPWISGKPAEIVFEGTHADQRSLSFEALIDHTTELSKEHFEFNMNMIPLNNVSLFKTPYLPPKIDRGFSDIIFDADFEEENFDLKVNVVARQTEFDFSSLSHSDNRFIDITQAVIRGLNRITLTTVINHRSEGTDFRLDSNLDEAVSRELKKIGSKALTDAKNRVNARLSQIRNEKMAEINSIFEKKQEAIVGKIEYYEEKVEEQRLMIEAKIEQIKNDIDQRKKAEENKVKKKAEGLLKDVLD
jgi:uncharacterized protein (TIGR03545 family)